MADLNWTYTENVKDHFMNPRNILDNLETYEYDGKGLAGNKKCGDEMLLVIKIDKEKQIITDCKWKTFGCASAIASTSKLSEMVIGMKIEDAYKLTPKDITAELGGLPDNKIHCSVLGDKALRTAIDDFYKTHGMKEKVTTEEAVVVCNCMHVTDHDIEEAVLEGARNYQTLQEMTKIGTVCGECKDESIALMNQYIKQYFKK